MISPVKLETNNRSPTNVQVVQARVQLRQNGLLAVARIDAQHLPAGHLGRDDEALGIELHRVGNAEVARDPLGLAACRDRSARSRWRPSPGSTAARRARPPCALGDGRFSSSTRGAPPSRSSSISRPPSRHSPMNSRPRCTVMPLAHGQVVAQHPGAAVGVPHADPAVHHLGGVELAVGVEGHVVGRDDVAALGADGLHRAGRRCRAR